MATPTVMTDLSTSLRASDLNKYLAAGGGKITCKVVWVRVRYNGSAWEVHSTTDSVEIVSGNVSYSTDHINITISGFTVAPVVMVSPALVNTDAAYWPKALATSATQLQVAFYNDAGVRQTAQSTNMDCYLIALGV